MIFDCDSHNPCQEVEKQHCKIPPIKTICMFFRFWLGIVAIARAFAIYSGYFWVDLFRDRLFAPARDEVSNLFGRLFAIWTAISICVVLALAITPKNKALYFLNMCIFAIVFGFMSSEYFYYKTATIEGSGSVFFFAGFTFLLLLYRLITGSAFADDDYKKK
jgi:hypothetical protein